MLNPKSELRDLEKRFQIYALFYSYYSSKMWSLPEWKNAVGVIKEFVEYKCNDKIAEGLRLLGNISSEDVEKGYFDYHRLFVGPDKLLAPPYESYYRNPDGLVMQKETLEVRDFYNKVGLSVIARGSEPDDHLALELEFICYILFRLFKSQRERGAFDRTFYQLYWDFYRKHLQHWIFPHCMDIAQNSSTIICRGMALVLSGFMELEQEESNSHQGGNSVEQTI